MPTSAALTFSLSACEPYIDADDAFDAMIVVRLQANVAFAAGTVLGEITSQPGFYGAYASGHTDGTQNPAGVLRRAYTTDAGKTVTDGVAITSGGGTTFTSATAGFTQADVGKVISITGAGATGAVLTTLIASVTNSTTIVLATGASTAVNPATFTYGGGNLLNYDEWGGTGLSASMYTKGHFRIQDCTGLDANAVTKLGGHIIEGAIGGTGIWTF